MLGLNKPMTNKATHYHTDYVNPYWKAGLVETRRHRHAHLLSLPEDPG
jgi:spore germination cell wall hydrolase CwlJ-like protein